ncbi:Zinc transporter 10 [Leucoagaricus sp. SymC.cos]|nr:Zinc transporter 10 [Leucoagaricus sp. SymC.cos]
MGLSRSTRISILLLIDVLFFFVELIVGYAVGSLALIADSFHMLNDVMSLVVALYAIKLATSTQTDSRYSYGWHRAEILAALVNGVFLLALCFSISLEALERFFDTPEISNPRLVVIVGSLGLASNIVGLFLFHEHTHSHSHSHDHSPSKAPSITVPSRPSSISGDTAPSKKIAIPRQRSSSPTSDAETTYSLYGHPAATRASLVLTAHELAQAWSPSSTTHRSSFSQHIRHNSEIPDSPRRPRRPRSMSVADPISHKILPSPSSEGTPLLQVQEQEDHGLMKSQSHSHAGSMNMRALVLHVLGDALGNVGVIATGLIIWKTSWPFKYYFDPIISLVITLIIFSSALPLVRSASFILLQGVPATVSLDEVKSSILAVPGVISLHDLHVWQLSETKIVASVHILSERNCDFMSIAAKIRRALHHLGIHSSTIQPEYIPPDTSIDSKRTDEMPCLILCPPDQACDPSQNSCCPPPIIDV